MALDKPGTGRESLQLLEVTSCSSSNAKLYMDRTYNGHFALYYDEEWLAIVRTTVNKIDDTTSSSSK